MARQALKGGTEVRGNTLRVYLYLLHAGVSELRDIQKALGFSTPSLASYHLTKLVQAGYVSQNEWGRYTVVESSTHEILEGFTRMGAFIVPHLFFFAVLFTGVIGFFAAMSLSNAGYVPLLVWASVAMVVVLWYETARVWRRLTSWK